MDDNYSYHPIFMVVFPWDEMMGLHDVVIFQIREILVGGSSSSWGCPQQIAGSFTKENPNLIWVKICLMDGGSPKSNLQNGGFLSHMDDLGVAL